MMKTENEEFEKLNQEIGFEFNKYVLVKPSVLEEIPPGALVVFLLDNNLEFNAWSKEVNERQREPGQPFVFVHIKNLLPQTCRLTELYIEKTLT